MIPAGDAEVILVGNELLKGERVDAHLAWLALAMRRYGLRVEQARVVRDTEDVIADAVRSCLGSVRVVIVCGGLGPTPDDVTREGVARGVGRPLEFDPDSWDRISAFFAERGRKVTENNRRQAHFPAGAAVLGNMRGTAPGFAVEENGTHVFALPGPPHEMQRMFERDVSPRLAAMLTRGPLRVETFRTFGAGESQLVEMFGTRLDALTAWEVSSLPWVTGVDIILTERRDASDADLDREADAVERAFRDGLGTKLYEHGERSLAAVVADALTRRRETLAVAESLTGGMISTALTDVPGASAYLLADLVVYGNAAKSEFAGVDAAAIAADGAVSEVVCRQLAEGARQRAGATWGLSTTGIAGPDGGSEEKPLGLTWLGLAWDGGCDVKRRVFAGERGDVRGKAAFGALWMLYDRLTRKDD